MADSDVEIRELKILIDLQNKALEKLTDTVAGKDGLLVKMAKIETKVNAIIGISGFAAGAAVTAIVAFLFVVVH